MQLLKSFEHLRISIVSRIRHWIFAALSAVNGVPGRRGPRLTDLSPEMDEMVADIVHRAWLMGIPIQSDWARLNGQAVSAAASLGLITSFDGGRFSRTWRVTAEGMQFLEEM
jgi:hypothetical protein